MPYLGLPRRDDLRLLMGLEQGKTSSSCTIRALGGHQSVVSARPIYNHLIPKYHVYGKNGYI